MKNLYQSRKGAASLFIVIFTALMVTVVTVGFSQVMLRNSQQALAADLSQSAYDAALAGVEDAKRALVRLAECEAIGDTTSCADISSAIAADDCDTTIESGVATLTANTESEVRVGDPALNQAYTCVKIDRFSRLYPATLNPATNSVVIPLQPVGSAGTTARIWWYASNDLEPGRTLNLSRINSVGTLLPTRTGWGNYGPPILRAQYVPGTVNNTDLDTQASTTFAYPKNAGGSGNVDSRRSGGFTISSAVCANSFAGSPLGLCRIDIPLSPNIPDGETGYMQLSGLYMQGNVSVNVELLNAGGTAVPLNGIPTVDSTGRANERFRRVVAQVKVGTGVSSSRPAPRAALDIQNTICKNFFITDDIADYSNSCTP